MSFFYHSVFNFLPAFQSFTHSANNYEGIVYLYVNYQDHRDLEMTIFQEIMYFDEK